MPHTHLGPNPGSARRPVGLPELPEASRQQPLLAGLLLAIGSVWILVPLTSLLTGARPALPDLGMVGVAVLLAAGVGQALWGLDLLLRRKTLTIDQSTLQVSVRGLFGGHRWSEPLANYRGLRHRRERVRHRYGWRIVHRLQLVHPDPAKEIDLVRTQGERRIAAARRQWAECLGLPVWSADGGAPRSPLQEPDRRAVEPNGVPTF